MLFSDDNVAAYININFEPAWESVRPVPLVTIDFGNGTVVRRTLHGNVATYACAGDGVVLDILPGIYEPNTYLDRLRQLKLLHQMVGAGTATESRSGLLVGYHRRQFESLDENESPLKLEELPRASITAAERGTRVILQPDKRIEAHGIAATISSDFQSIASEDLPHWEALAKDTDLNEQFRRQAIHQYLMDQKESLRPEQITRWLYREVLHADLDDPYLGLGKVLFDDYPFPTSH